MKSGTVAKLDGSALYVRESDTGTVKTVVLDDGLLLTAEIRQENGRIWINDGILPWWNEVEAAPSRDAASDNDLGGE